MQFAAASRDGLCRQLVSRARDLLGELGAGAYHGRHVQQRWRLELMAEGSMLCWPLLWLAVKALTPTPRSLARSCMQRSSTSRRANSRRPWLSPPCLRSAVASPAVSTHSDRTQPAPCCVLWREGETFGSHLGLRRQRRGHGPRDRHVLVTAGPLVSVAIVQARAQHVVAGRLLDLVPLRPNAGLCLSADALRKEHGR